MTNNNIDIYEVALTVRVSAGSSDTARAIANDLLLSRGLAAGNLQVTNYGAAGDSAGRLAFLGPGGSHAKLDESLFEEESTASLDFLFEQDSDNAA